MLYQWNAREVFGKSIAETIVPDDKHTLIGAVMAEITAVKNKAIK